MQHHTRAMVAACVFAVLTGKKVAGMYDHCAQRRLKVAAQSRGNVLRGFDGDRGTGFAGTLPELFDAGDQTYISCEIDGETAKGYDRGSSSAFSAHISEDLVRVYDYGEEAWFAYDIQDPQAEKSYHRTL